MLVSVVIPVFNTSPYLRECLDSVLSQTLTDFEVICVDDGRCVAGKAASWLCSVSDCYTILWTVLDIQDPTSPPFALAIS